MDDNIIKLILALISACIAFLASYFSTEATISEKIAKLITEAAKLDIIGSEKMKIVVNKLYSLVPLPFRGIINKAKIESNVQTIYDKMKEFAETENSK